MIGTIANWLSAVVALAALAVSIGVFRAQRHREEFELARSLHHDLTTGEVAHARDLLGTLVRSGEPVDYEAGPHLRHAYFTLLWCFERIEVGHRIIRGRRPRKYLIEVIKWHVLEWSVDINTVRVKLTEGLGKLDDGHSHGGLDELTQVVKGRSGGKVRSDQ